MGRAGRSQQTVPVTMTRNNSKVQPTQNVNDRGDKVVVNGAKESMLAIINKHVCICGKHTLEDSTVKFLSQNKMKVSYDTIVWMLTFAKRNCEPELYYTIAKEYLGKMQKKEYQDESHRSETYVDLKKKTLRKFTWSAELWLADSMDIKTIEESVGALYSKGLSREKAIDKIRNYLKKINFQDCLNFENSRCSFLSTRAFELESRSQVVAQKELFQFESLKNYEEEISKSTPLLENPREENRLFVLGDCLNTPLGQSEKPRSYDLFDMLLFQSNDSACSLFSNCLSYQ